MTIEVVEARFPASREITGNLPTRASAPSLLLDLSVDRIQCDSERIPYISKQGIIRCVRKPSRKTVGRNRETATRVAAHHDRVEQRFQQAEGRCVGRAPPAGQRENKAWPKPAHYVGVLTRRTHLGWPPLRANWKWQRRQQLQTAYRDAENVSRLMAPRSRNSVFSGGASPANRRQIRLREPKDLHQQWDQGLHGSRRPSNWRDCPQARRQGALSVRSGSNPVRWLSFGP
jgi:hypothetical protein